MESKEAYIEISLPQFGNTVLYSDDMNYALKNKYFFPPSLVKTENG